MKNTILLVLITLSLSAGSAQDFSQLQLNKISPDELSRDLELLWQGIDQYHSGAYWYTPRDSIKAAFDQVREQLKDSLTTLGFHRLVAPLVALTREDHCNIFLPTDIRRAIFNSALLFPFRVVFLDRKMYVELDGSNSGKDLRSLEILGINGRSPKDLVLLLGQHFSSDGFIERVKYSDLSGFSFAYHHYLEFGEVPSFELVYQNENVKLDTIVINARTLPAMREKIQERYSEAERANEELPPMDFSVLNDSTAYLAVRTFDSGDLRQDKRYPSYRKFLASSFATVVESGIQRLIVDVSDNTGGNEGNENLLYSYLGENYQKYIKVRAKAQDVTLDNGIDPPQRARTFSFLEKWFFNQRMPDGSYERKPNAGHGLMAYKREPKHKFEGELFVIISPITYSGGSEFSNMVYTQTEAIFIGEETGGGFYGNTSGYGFELELPHSGITVDLPALQFVMDVEGLPFGRGVIPHYQAIPDIQTYLKGPEAILNFILELYPRLLDGRDLKL
ncbi:MAG: S41 family peptidase [Bacteroidota bacterium]